MTANDEIWVLGQKVRLLETHESYAMIEVVSSPGVPGPPPHHHRDESEFFHIITGRLDCMIDGEWRSYADGDFVEVPAGTTHTFANNSDEDVVWVTGWRPRGFERFFRDFGVPASEPDGQGRSLDGAIVQKVIETAESYGMIIDLTDAPEG